MDCCRRHRFFCFFYLEYFLVNTQTKASYTHTHTHKGTKEETTQQGTLSLKSDYDRSYIFLVFFPPLCPCSPYLAKYTTTVLIAPVVIIKHNGTQEKNIYCFKGDDARTNI